MGVPNAAQYAEVTIFDKYHRTILETIKDMP